MKLWDKGTTTLETIHQFTVGNDREMDKRLAKYDIQGTIAHVKMLASVSLMTESELDIILPELHQLLERVLKPNFEIPLECEDIHSYVEFELTKELGEIGKKVHAARSRNDQVLVDIHLYLKEVILHFKTQVIAFGNQLCDLAECYSTIGLPGYTHTQIAMPSSFGMWFSAYAECLADDVILLETAYKWVDQNPLGTAAGYGSNFPIDRQLTTDLLGFSTLKYNPIAAQLNRGKLEQTVCFAMSSLATTLGKLASDSVLYLCQNFEFIHFPDELTTGSSIMPHKKNPDVFELIRGKCNQVSAISVEIQAITRNLTSGYHRDFQLLKEPLFRSIDLTESCLSMMQYMMQHIKVNPDLLEKPMYSTVYSVDAVAKYVEEGLAFRDAYVLVGQEIAEGKVLYKSNVKTTHLGSLDTLCISEIRDKLLN